MYAITGITGNVGGSVAQNLLTAGRSVRAVMRDVGKGNVWAKRGCEVVKADIADTTSLASAFRGAEGVFVLVPPNFDPAPGLAEARATAAVAKVSALKKLVRAESSTCPRSAHKQGESNLLTQHTIIEQALSELPVPTTFLFDPRRSWRIFAGMSRRREKAVAS